MRLWLAGVVLAGSVPITSAAETWTCTYRPWVDLKRTVHGELRIDGKSAEYTDHLFPDVLHKPLRLRVLNRSELGFTAVAGLNERSQSGPIVGVTVLIVKLPSGEFTLTSVYGAGDETKQSAGTCAKQ
jgi:hypothetical protein